MQMSVLYVILAAMLAGGAAWSSQPWIALLFLLVIAVSWQIHVLEVKLNKLLDRDGIFVGREEINR